MGRKTKEGHAPPQEQGGSGTCRLGGQTESKAAPVKSGHRPPSGGVTWPVRPQKPEPVPFSDEPWPQPHTPVDVGVYAPQHPTFSAPRDTCTAESTLTSRGSVSWAGEHPSKALSMEHKKRKKIWEYFHYNEARCSKPQSRRTRGPFPSTRKVCLLPTCAVCPHTPTSL